MKKPSTLTFWTAVSILGLAATATAQGAVRVAPSAPAVKASKAKSDASLQKRLKEVIALLADDDLSPAQRARAAKTLAEALAQIARQDENVLFVAPGSGDGEGHIVRGKGGVFGLGEVKIDGAKIDVVQPDKGSRVMGLGSGSGGNFTYRIKKDDGDGPADAPGIAVVRSEDGKPAALRLLAKNEAPSADKKDHVIEWRVMDENGNKPPATFNWVLEDGLVKVSAEKAKAAAEKAKAAAEKTHWAFVQRDAAQKAAAKNDEGVRRKIEGLVAERLRLSEHKEVMGRELAEVRRGVARIRHEESNDDIREMIAAMRAEMREIRKLLNSMQKAQRGGVNEHEVEVEREHEGRSPAGRVRLRERAERGRQQHEEEHVLELELTDVTHGKSHEVTETEDEEIVEEVVIETLPAGRYVPTPPAPPAAPAAPALRRLLRQ